MKKEIKKFEDVRLSPEIKKGISSMGFEEMTPIQSESIPVILDGRDIVGQAQTGTGKTAAFGIPALESIDENNKNVQVLILCPTRELSIQVAKEIGNLGRYKKGLYTLPIYGGQQINRQIRSLKRGVQIVVGTPGRTIDHIKRGTLRLDNIEMMILDEADEMFDMGFRDDIEQVMRKLKKDRQTVFFSATMPKEIINFASRYQKNPEIIKVAHKELTMPNIEQCYFDVNENMKTEILTRSIDVYNPRLAVVFCNTKRKVDRVTGNLQSRGYFVDGLHGDLNQNQRDKVMNKFRNGTIDILVATDVAARGIDVDEVDIVFNYDLPQDEEYYVHRIGRTARAGREGMAISFVTKREKNRLRTIERYAKTKISRKPIPTIEDVEDVYIEKLNKEILETINKNDLEESRIVLNNILSKGLDLYDVAASLIKLVNKESENKIKKSENNTLNKNKEKNLDSKTRIYINTGRRNGIGPGNILAAIVQDAGIHKDYVGSIDIFDKYTFVDIDSSKADLVIKRLNGEQINNRNVLVEKANPRN